MQRTRRAAARQIVDRAAPLWARGDIAQQIADALGLTRGQIMGFVHRNRDRFPPRRPQRAADLALERDAALAVADRLWPAGIPIAGIAATAGVEAERLRNWIRSAGPARFPERAPGTVRDMPRTSIPARASGRAVETGDARDVASAPPAPVDHASRADAFRPLPGTTPELLWQATGCRWPVHVDGSDPARTATLHCCNASMPAKDPDDRRSGLPPYCPVHAEMARGKGTESERRAPRALLALAGPGRVAA